MAASQYLSMLATPRARVQYGTLALRPTPEVEGQFYYAYDVNSGEGALYVADGTGDTDWREVGAQDNQINIPVGLESALPGAPDGVGAVYYASDTRRLYLSADGTTWVNVGIALTAVKGQIISSGSDGKLYVTTPGTNGQLVAYNDAADGGLEAVDPAAQTLEIIDTDEYNVPTTGVQIIASKFVIPYPYLEEVEAGIAKLTFPTRAFPVYDESNTVVISSTYELQFPDGWVDDSEALDGRAIISPPPGTVAGTIQIEELDGTPSGAFDTLKLPNGTLTDNGDGSATYTPDAGTIVIQELDGTPTGSFTTLKLPNGTLTDNGDGSATYTPATPSITIKEVDGTPSDTFHTLEFPNSTLTDEGGGVARYTPAGSSGATVPTWKWRKTALQNIINGSFNDVIFPTQVFGDSDITYSSGLFTIVNTGLYEVNYSLECDMVNVGTPTSLEFDAYFVGSIFHRNFAVFPADSTRVTVQATFKYEVTAANTTFKISAQGGITTGDELNIYYVNGAALTAWVEFTKLS
jgi:hypothetical protein